MSTTRSIVNISNPPQKYNDSIFINIIYKNMIAAKGFCGFFALKIMIELGIDYLYVRRKHYEKMC